MQNLLSPRWMAVKAILFVVMALLAGASVFCQNPTWTTGICLALLVWASSRAYYFAFYVIEHYVDSSFRFAGLGAFVAWWWRKRREPPAN